MSKVKIVFLIGFPILCFFIVYFGFGFDGLYGQDGYEYARYTQALRNYLISGEAPGDYFWPLYYPILGTLGSFITQDAGISLLLVSVLSLSFSGYYLVKIIDLLFPHKSFFSKKSIIYVTVFYLLSPFIFKHGMLVMSDMLSTVFIVFTLYYFIKYKNTQVIKYFYGIAIFSVLAIMTRYASAVIVLPFIVCSLFLFLKQKNILFHFLFLTAIVSIIFAPHFLIRHTSSVDFLQHPWLQDWSYINFFKNDFSTDGGNLSYQTPNIVYAFSNLFHPRFLFLGIVFIPFIFMKRFAFPFQKNIWISVILYALFLAGIPFQNNRFLILSFPLILVLVYPVFIFFSSLKWVKRFFYLGIASIVCIQLFLITKALHSSFQRNKLEKEIVKILETYQNQKLYSFDIDIALQGRNLKFDYHNLWKKRYKNLDAGDLILFNFSKFEEQWKGKNPMLNWNYITNQYHLKVIENCPDGWVLYTIEKK